MVIIIIVIVLTLLSSIILISQILNTIPNATALVYKVSNPHISASGSNVYVVWQQNVLSKSSILFKKSTNDGASFSSAIKLSNNNENATNPQIAAYGRNVYVVWSDYDNSSSDYNIFFKRSKDNGNTFSDSSNLENFTFGHQEIAAYGRNVYVVWSGSTRSPAGFGLVLGKSIDGGDRFDLDTLSGKAINPQIAAYGRNVYVVWQDYNYTNLHLNADIVFTRSTDNGSKFSPLFPAKMLSNNTNRFSNPHIAVSGDSVYVIWNTRFDIFSLLKRSTDNGNTFGGAVQPETKIGPLESIGRGETPQIAATGGNLYLVWIFITRGGPALEFGVSSDKGNTFGNETTIDRLALLESPHMSIYGNNVYIVWKSGDSILFNRSTDNGNTFGLTTKLSN
jgi:hypothetical protein